MLDLRDKAIKAPINLFEELKESMVIKVKTGMMTMLHQRKKIRPQHL